MPASPSAAEIFLSEFHDARPGLTAKAFGSLEAVTGKRRYRSSYDLLAGAIPAAADRILDLACGDGHLLTLVAAARGAAGGLIGVDLSAGELALARSRLDPAVVLCQARSQALPLASASVDCVVSHMALMLMGEGEPVLQEVRRVLQPGGTFAGVVGATVPDTVAWKLYLEAFSRRPRLERWAGMRMGDRRWRDADGIRALLAPAFAEVVVQDIQTTQRLSPPQVWLHMLEMYDLYYLAEAERQVIEREYLAALAPHCGADGKVDLPGALRFFHARAA